MKVRWSDQSQKRLSQIAAFISADSPSRASELCERLLGSEKQLERFPYSGALLPEDGAYRQIVIDGYRILYVIEEDEVVVATVVEPRRGGVDLSSG